VKRRRWYARKRSSPRNPRAHRSYRSETVKLWKSANAPHATITFSASTAPWYTRRGVAGFLADGGYDHLRTIRRIYARQAALMADAVGKHFPNGTRVSRPAGGYILRIECPEYVDALNLHERAIGAGISTAPGQIFSARGK
jgi:DNA-binding transcriptional MocR family regulator